MINKYGIEIESCHSLSEGLTLINYYLSNYDFTDEEYEEIDEVAKNLNERKYYGEINKWKDVVG